LRCNAGQQARQQFAAVPHRHNCRQTQRASSRVIAIMRLMKRLLFLVSFSGALLFGQNLSDVHSVYLLPMTHGLDQYLAIRLTGEHVFQVVTDPKRADAIFTDRIGAAFESKLVDLTSNPEPVASDSDEQPVTGSSGKSASKLADPSVNSSFARTKGTLFLVNPKSHQVLWSAYKPSKDSSSGQLDRTASDIVSRLKRDLKQK